MWNPLDLIGQARGIIDELRVDDVEKMEATAKLEKVIQGQRHDIEETIRLGVSTRADIIKSEMAQGDKFTKRARPAVVYWGMLLITVREVVVWVKDVPPPPLPAEFWWAWTGVVSVWFVARTADKRGAVSEKLQSVVGAITGRGTT